MPFLYSTNGEVLWHHDIRHKLNRSPEFFGFYTPDALLEVLGRDFEADCAKLLATPNDHPLIRDYQKEANTATEKAVTERKRAMLIAMATGTGKTFTPVNQIYRLIKSGVAKRVLFLVDRRALAAQAVKAFASFEAEPGLKFSQVYEVYHQQFHMDDLEEDEKWGPKVLPKGYLAERSSSGTLTPDEEAEYDSYLHVANVLAIMQSKARVVLGEKPLTHS